MHVYTTGNKLAATYFKAHSSAKRAAEFFKTYKEHKDKRCEIVMGFDPHVQSPSQKHKFIIQIYCDSPNCNPNEVFGYLIVVKHQYKGGSLL